MVQSNQVSPGMTILIGKKLYRIESSIKVTVAKGTPFIKTKLMDLVSKKVIEKNFKPTQQLQEIQLEERNLEFLYVEKDHCLFLDVDNLEHLLVPSTIVGDRANYLREGTELKGSVFEGTIYSIELPQFLEIMISSTEDSDEKTNGAGDKKATLETGAVLEVPQYIEMGDVIKVDTTTNEYIQRV